MTPHVCPVCWATVKHTVRHNIPQHFDSIREHVCPASGYPWTVTIARPAEYQVSA